MWIERVDDGWAAAPSHAGPAGTVVVRLDAVIVEFDRIDHGRIVRLDVSDDTAAAPVLGLIATRLEGLAAQHRIEADVEILDSPLWGERFALAAVARLVDDVERLRESEPASALLAAAECADIANGLGDLAPDGAAAALAWCRDLLASAAALDGGLTLPSAQVGPARELAARLHRWAPRADENLVAALGEPIEEDVRLASRPEHVRAMFKESTTPIPWADAVADPFVWTVEIGGQDRPGTGTVRMVDDGVVEIALVWRDGDVDLWAYLYGPTNLAGAAVLIAAGPLVRVGDLLRGWFGPFDDRPVSARFAAAPYRKPGDPESVVERARLAIRDGVKALDLEDHDPVEAGVQWQVCAERWFGVAELGRGAIAYDRAADALDPLDAAEAREARHWSVAVAPAWAMPSIHGRSGRPFRPLWSGTTPSGVRPS